MRYLRPDLRHLGRLLQRHPMHRWALLFADPVTSHRARAIVARSACAVTSHRSKSAHGDAANAPCASDGSIAARMCDPRSCMRPTNALPRATAARAHGSDRQASASTARAVRAV